MNKKEEFKSLLVDGDLYEFYYAVLKEGTLPLGEKHRFENSENDFIEIVDIQEFNENIDIEHQSIDQITQVVFTWSKYPDDLFMIKHCYESWGGGYCHFEQVTEEQVTKTVYTIVE